ncbi:MAG: NUDIX domain-containing protein [Campylobacterota bacterium]|nr:NUDIX domain-containing protein [Campylobacterota bacterium]
MFEKRNAYGVCLYRNIGDEIYILLCKSIFSINKWGFLKGVQNNNETITQTAIREFYEESGIKVSINILEDYYQQINFEKDIGVFLVNYDKIPYNVDNFFNDLSLKDNYICSENSEVEFFNINNLPLIKKKQIYLVDDIVKYLKE